LLILCIKQKQNLLFIIQTQQQRQGTYPVFAKGIIVAEEMAEAVLLAQHSRSTEAQNKSDKVPNVSLCFCFPESNLCRFQKEREKGIKNWKRLIHRALVFKRLGREVFKQ
jgi:hypothetical protein